MHKSSNGQKILPSTRSKFNFAWCLAPLRNSQRREFCHAYTTHEKQKCQKICSGFQLIWQSTLFCYLGSPVELSSQQVSDVQKSGSKTNIGENVWCDLNSPTSQIPKNINLRRPALPKMQMSLQHETPLIESHPVTRRPAMHSPSETDMRHKQQKRFVTLNPRMLISEWIKPKCSQWNKNRKLKRSENKHNLRREWNTEKCKSKNPTSLESTRLRNTQRINAQLQPYPNEWQNVTTKFKQNSHSNNSTKESTTGRDGVRAQPANNLQTIHVLQQNSWQLYLKQETPTDQTKCDPVLAR